MKKELLGEFVRGSDDGRQYLRLNLNRPGMVLAKTIARRLNHALFETTDPATGEEMTFTVARVHDHGSVEVLIPDRPTWARVMKTPYPQFLQDPIHYLDRIMNIKVSDRDSLLENPVVVINDTNKTVSWPGRVVVQPGCVVVGSLVIGSSEKESTLRKLLDQLIELAATPQMLIDAVRALHAAGLLEAKLRSQ